MRKNTKKRFYRLLNIVTPVLLYLLFIQLDLSRFMVHETMSWTSLVAFFAMTMLPAILFVWFIAAITGMFNWSDNNTDEH